MYTLSWYVSHLFSSWSFESIGFYTDCQLERGPARQLTQHGIIAQSWNKWSRPSSVCDKIMFASLEALYVTIRFFNFYSVTATVTQHSIPQHDINEKMRAAQKTASTNKPDLYLGKISHIWFLPSKLLMTDEAARLPVTTWSVWQQQHAKDKLLYLCHVKIWKTPCGKTDLTPVHSLFYEFLSGLDIWARPLKSSNLLRLGKPVRTKMDEFSENFRTAFESLPPPLFR